MGFYQSFICSKLTHYVRLVLRYQSSCVVTLLTCTKLVKTVPTHVMLHSWHHVTGSGYMYLGCKFYLFLQLCNTGCLLHGQHEGPPPCTGHLRLHPPHLFQFAFFAQETYVFALRLIPLLYIAKLGR